MFENPLLVPYIEKEISSMYQRVQDFTNLKDVERILIREFRKEKGKPFIPPGFSGLDMMNRLKYTIDEVDFCENRVIHSWVDYAGIIPILGKKFKGLPHGAQHAISTRFHQ